MVQYFSLTTKQHQPAYQPQKPSLGARARNMESPCVGVSDHRLVNLYLRVWPRWCARRTQGFIMVRAECPYVQFAAAARVISTKRFVVGGTNNQERDRSQVSDGKVERVLRAWMLLSCVV